MVLYGVGAYLLHFAPALTEEDLGVRDDWGAKMKVACDGKYVQDLDFETATKLFLCFGIFGAYDGFCLRAVKFPAINHAKPWAGKEGVGFVIARVAISLVLSASVLLFTPRGL